MMAVTQKRRERIVVFGFKDTLVGQLLELLKSVCAYEVQYFISVGGIPKVDIEAEHRRRPNNKTEFVRDGKIFNSPVLPTTDYLERIVSDGIDKVFVLEENPYVRKGIFDSLATANITPASFIHPSTFFGGKNSLGVGVIAFPNCYIGYKTDIGDGTIIQSNSVIEHHNSIGKFCNINPRLTTGGSTFIGDFVEINLSVDIINRIRVENGARVGAGSLVLSDCKSGFLYYGRPARAVRLISN